MLDAKIETLITVNETKSFTKAAEQLSLTQPAVSQHIKQLESEFGIKLFYRDSGELKTTPEGEIVLKYAKRIKALHQNLQQRLLDEKNHTKRIAAGITHTAENNRMSNIFAKYCNENEGVRITIISDTINNLYNKLKNYELDLAIVEGKLSDPSLNSILLDTDCLMLAVSNSNPLANKSMVTLNELKKEKMILRLPNSGTRNLFVSHLLSNNVSIDEFNVILEVDNISTIKELVRQNFGVSILAKSVCMDDVKKGDIKILPVENLSMTREINIVYHKDFEHTAALSEIMKLYYTMSDNSFNMYE